MVDEQPALGGLDGDRAPAHLGRLPGVGNGAHHVAVAPPEAQVGALAVEDVAKRRVPVVGRAGQHGEAAVDLAGEEHAVAVERQVRVFSLVEGDEVVRPGHTDGGAVVPVAPSHVVAVVDAYDPGIVAVDEIADLGVIGDELEPLGGDVPLEAVAREAGVQLHAPGPIVAAENAGEAALIRDDGAIEDAVGRGDEVPGYHRVAGVTP